MPSLGPSALEAGRDQAPSTHTLLFRPCPENPVLDCGTLQVPVDYEQPHEASLGIAVIRARATNPGARIGVLVGNPGGPGLSGVDFVLALANAPLPVRARFDIVSFDPRGVKRSGQVRCQFDVGARPDPSDDAALTAYFDELGQRHAEACLAQNGPHVAHLGTVNVARDIDMIRHALGESQITYAAGSYGSLLGATYASMFPKRLRAMLLDGGLAPAFRDFNVESWSEYSQGFELAFQRLDQLCRRDTSCALGHIGVVPALDSVLAVLRAAPVAGPNGVPLTAGRVQDLAALLLQSERNWPLLVRALAGGYAGDFTLFLQLLPAVLGERNHALFPIWCNDHGTRRSAADVLRIDEAIGALSPRFFGRFFLAEAVSLCGSWPAADPPHIRDVSHRVERPILILANDFDPNTPLVDARAMAQALGMEQSLLRYEGGGHTAFFKGIGCIDAAANDYLINLTLPPAGATCPAMPVSFGPPASTRTIAAAAALGANPELWGTSPVQLPTRER